VGFRSLQHIRAWRSTHAAGAADCFVPPSGFGYPLGGLRPPRPCGFCFAPAALLGFALRSFLLSEGTRRVSGRMDPRTVSPIGIPVRRSGRAGPMGRGFWVFTLSRVPGDRRGIRPPTAGCSHGLRPSRAIRRKPDPGFRPDSSLALSGCRPRERRPPAPRSINRLPLGQARDSASRIGGLSNPCRVPAPVCSRRLSPVDVRVMSSPCRAPCITAGCHDA